MSLVLSIDLGTSGCRSAVYDNELNILSEAKTDIPLIILSDMQIEQCAQTWWKAVKDTIKEAAALCDIRKIRAVSISSQGISVVPVDERGRVLHNAISWLDTRAAQQEHELGKKYGLQGIYDKTGLRLSALYSLPKIMWMQNNISSIMAKTHKLLLPMDYILYRLCGRYVTDHTMAGGTMLYNITSRSWDAGLLKDYKIAEDILPEILEAGTKAGTILPEVAQELGLSPEVTIAVGAQDQKCAAYGAGAARSIATVSLGTASCITKISNAPIHDCRMRIPCFSYIQKGFWDLESIINTAGSALQWFRDKFAPSLSFTQLIQLAEKWDGPCCVQFYPYLAGASSPHWGNCSGVFAGLTLHSDLGQCVRSILEGIAYSIQENIDVFDELAGNTDTLRIFGGGANSDVWCRIIADIADKPIVRMKSSDTALAGAAKLAFESIGEESAESVGIDHIFDPDKESTAKYNAAYEKYESCRSRYFE